MIASISNAMIPYQNDLVQSTVEVMWTDYETQRSLYVNHERCISVPTVRLKWNYTRIVLGFTLIVEQQSKR